jgi:hypothetical protein
MRQSTTAVMLAMVAAVMLSVGAAAQSSTGATTTQTPSGTTPTQTPGAQAQKPAPTPTAGAVTLEGCLVQEKDVPGRSPNIVEKAGIMEDYILTDSKVVSGSAPSSPGATGTSGAAATGTSGATARYHVKGLSDDRLKPMLGRRVQVEGRLQDLDKPTPGSTDLPDIQATTIRQVSGECPASK